MVVDLINNHHAHIHHVLAESVQPFVSRSGWQDAMTFLITHWALGDGTLFLYVNVAVGVDRVWACRDEGAGFAMLAIDDPADAFALVDMGQVHQSVIGFGSFLANRALRFFIVCFSLFWFLNGCFLLILILSWVLCDS